MNIDLCFPGESVAFRSGLLKRSLVELAKWLLELGPMWYWPMQRLNQAVISREGVEEVLVCLNAGQGVLIATPHLGNWELAGLAGSEVFPLTILYKPPKIHGLEDVARQARARAGAQVVSTNQGGLKRIISALRAGEAVGLLPDQEPQDLASGVYAPFFHVDALTMTLFQKLVRKTGAAVFFATMARGQKGTYHFRFRRVNDDIGHEDEAIAATTLNRELEKTICEHPEQYLWAYKRFKHRPEGQVKIYG